MAKSAKDSATIVRDEAGRLTDEAKARANRVATEGKRALNQTEKDAKKNLK